MSSDTEVAGGLMADEDIGWFKISRRVRKSSVWWKSPPATFKVLMFMLDEAQALDNTCPGEVHMSPTVIAGLCNLPLSDVEEAIEILSAEDEASHTREDKRTLEALPDGAGYRLVNFDRYHPEAAGRRGAAAVKRHIRAKKAAKARWGRHDEEVTEDAPEKLVDQETGRVVQPVCWPAGPAGPVVLPAVPRELDAGEQAAVLGADGGAAAEGHRAVDRGDGAAAREDPAAGVPGVRRVRGDAPSGLPEAAGSGVAVPAASPGGASVGGIAAGRDGGAKTVVEPGSSEPALNADAGGAPGGRKEPQPAPPSGPTDRGVAELADAPESRSRESVAPTETRTRSGSADAGSTPAPTTTYTPTIEYPTQELRRAAEREAHELCGWLEEWVGRTSMQVFKEASDYPGAQGMKTRAESCSGPRLERTLVTLRDWKVAVEMLRVSGRVSPDAAWRARPQVGAAAAPVAPRTSQSAQWDDAERIFWERRGLEVGDAGLRGGQARVDAGAPGGALVPGKR